jgi:SAM-dependent methyltransferase
MAHLASVADNSATALKSPRMRFIEQAFDIDSLLAKPLFAHLATCGQAGPCETPLWFLWEDEALWMIAGSSSGFVKRLRNDARAAIGIVDFDLERGFLRHLGFRGSATIEPMDGERRTRLVRRYLGSEDQWSPWFRQAIVDRQDVLIRFIPETAVARDQSYFRYCDSTNTLPALERSEFLQGWHARFPGTTSATFWYGNIAGDGRSSYALLVDDVASLPRLETVVDLACGDGYLLAMLAERLPAAAIVGIDITPEELELASNRHLPQNVRLSGGRAEALPLPDAGADAVVCHMALMLFDNAQSVVDELARVIRPGGVFAAVLGPAPGSSELVTQYGALLHEAEHAESLPPLRVGDPATNTEQSLLTLFSGDAWSELIVDDVTLSFEGSDEQIKATLLGMYNVARLSDRGRAELARRLSSIIFERRQTGLSTECALGLRHLVVRRTRN